MKKTVLAIAIAVASTPALADESTKELAQEAKGIVKVFAGALKGELKTAMKSGGPVEAIQVCNRVAPAIANEQSDKSSWSVGRTSLKLRNPDNQPDAWELAVLKKFEERKANGEDVKPMAHFEVVEEDGKKVFRFMKAIPTGEVCLNCHGSDLKPAVAEQINKLYPNDQATGFALGDIRGAFTLSREL